MTEAKKSLKRTLIGKVVSAKRAKTVTVLVERKVTHPLYGKIIKLSKKYHAHVDNGVARDGDLVMIEECAPISKTKAWRVREVLAKGSEV